MSEDEDNEAEYQYYRQRALVRPHWPILQNLTDTRGSRLGHAPYSPPGIGGSADASYEFAPPSTNVQLNFAPAHFAQEFRFGAKAPSTTAPNSSRSCFAANFLYRFPPSNFPGFQLGNTSAPAFHFGANQRSSLSSSHPLHFGADDVA